MQRMENNVFETSDRIRREWQCFPLSINQLYKRFNVKKVREIGDIFAIRTRNHYKKICTEDIKSKVKNSIIEELVFRIPLIFHELPEK